MTIVAGSVALALLLLLWAAAPLLTTTTSLSSAVRLGNPVEVADEAAYTAAMREEEQEQQQPATATVVVGLKDDLMRGLARPFAADVWNALLEEGAPSLEEDGSKNKPPPVAMEVGMHSIGQCMAAAKLGYEVHCFEPSPKSFRKVQRNPDVTGAGPELKARINLYNMAAGPRSHEMVPFTSGGSTGDHVGKSDMWAMHPESHADQNVVEVPTVALDDIVGALTGDDRTVFVAKVDTQGFEPGVMAGLATSLRDHKVRHVLFEYWPRGIEMLSSDAGATATTTGGRCAAAELLKTIAGYGYDLYAMPAESHPKSRLYARNALREEMKKTRPLDNVDDNCRWYFELEKRFPQDDYKMGYWSDVLAVAQGGGDYHRRTPKTDLGRVLSRVP